MSHDAPLRNADAKVIASFVLVLAALVAAIVVAVDVPSIDGSRVLQQLHPIRSAHAQPGSNASAPVVEGSAAKTTPEDNWVADESSHGLRPDAAH